MPDLGMPGGHGQHSKVNIVTSPRADEENVRVPSRPFAAEIATGGQREEGG